MKHHPVHAGFREVLSEAMKERHLRPDLVKLPDGSEECEWAAHERGAMHNEVNRVRKENGLPPATLEEVARREMWACGHADYYAKFALYCAELALQVDGYETRR